MAAFATVLQMTIFPACSSGLYMMARNFSCGPLTVIVLRNSQSDAASGIRSPAARFCAFRLASAARST